MKARYNFLSILISLAFLFFYKMAYPEILDEPYMVFLILLFSVIALFNTVVFGVKFIKGEDF